MGRPEKSGRPFLITTMTEKFFKLTADGTIREVTVTERDIQVDGTIISRFSADIAIRIPNLMSAAVLPEVAGLGNIGACVRKASITLTARLAALPMRCAFIMKDGFMVPDFKKGNADPEIRLTWNIPDSMRVYFVANFLVPLAVDVQFVVAADSAGRWYRLPLSNLREDCQLCHGAYDGNGATAIDMMSKAWLQFHKSRWQSDLVNRGTDSEMNSKKLFRFKPLEPSGFEQVAPDNHTWEELSSRVSTAFLMENIVI